MRNVFKARKWICLLAVMCIAAVSLFAGGGTQTTKPATAPSTDSGSPKYGGSLSVIVVAPRTMNLAKSSTTGDWPVMDPILEQLGRYTMEGITEPWLAESFNSDPNTNTCTIKLRANVFFTDGSSCDADAVAWNFQKYIDNGKGSEIGAPKSIETPDNLTVVIHYDGWANNWPDVLGQVHIMSKKAYMDHGEDWCTTNAVGTGPFMVDQYIPNTRLILKKNPNYRIKGLPYLDQLIEEFITDVNTQVSAFMNNEVAFVGGTNPVIATRLEAAGFKNVAGQSPAFANIYHFLPSSKDPNAPTSNLQVRKAIMHCIDWDSVAKALTNGRGIALNQFGIKGAVSYNDDVKFYDYDPALAKKMLADAGYPNGFSTTIYGTAGIDGHEAIAVALQACLKEIGITTNIEMLDPAAMTQRQVNEALNCFIVNVGSSMMDFTSNYIRLYSSEGIKNHGQMVQPPDYVQALFGARAAKTFTEKKSLLQSAAQKLTEEYVMVVPLAASFAVCYVQDYAHDLGFYAFGDQTIWTPEKAWNSK